MIKVGIIGGGGRVGSNFAYALQMSGIASDIVINDVMAETAEGEALDLRHGASYAGRCNIRHGSIADLRDMDLIMVSAGSRRKPDESRLDLINRNVGIMRSVLEQITQVNRSAFLLIVSNPVDIMTYIAATATGLPRNKVIGLGNVLDTVRFRSLIGEYFNVDPRDVEATLMGEHGDTMFPVWSRAAVGGIPIHNMPGYSREKMNEIFEQTRKGGAEVIRLKGGAGWAVGYSILMVAEAIAQDRRNVLPVASYIEDYHGVKDVCLSVPTIVGKNGIESRPVMDLLPEELESLRKAEAALKEVINSLA
ncbi:MAG TPA: L-lactate dehydrogenase [bacterium]|nr:L-lactate dehydrogenase [bacterium]